MRERIRSLSFVTLRFPTKHMLTDSHPFNARKGYLQLLVHEAIAKVSCIFPCHSCKKQSPAATLLETTKGVSILTVFTILGRGGVPLGF